MRWRRCCRAWWRASRLNRIVAAALGLLALVLLAAGAAGLSGQKRLVEVVVRYEIDPFSWLLLLGILAVALLVGLRPRRGLAALMLWLPAFWVSYSLWMYPQLNGTRSPGDLMVEVARRTGPQGQLALPDFDEEFLLQARQPSVHFGRETALVAQLARAYAWLSEAPGSRWMLIEQRRRLDLSCVALDQAIDLGHQNRDDWWLIPGTAFASCRGDTAAAPLFVAPTTAAARPAIPP